MAKKSDKDAMPIAKTSFELPRLLLCEGMDDCEFFSRLIEVRKLPRFHIRSTGEGRYQRGGNSKFGQALLAIQSNPNFPSIKEIVVVSDNDRSHQVSFERVRRQIEEAGLRSPPTSKTKSDGRPSVTIMMLPLDESPGNLECVCSAAASRAAPSSVRERVDNCNAILIEDEWPDNRKGKLKLRVLLSTLAPDPFIALPTVFRDPKFCGLIPLDDPCFDGIADLLATICPAPNDASLSSSSVADPEKISTRHPQKKGESSIRPRYRRR